MKFNFFLMTPGKRDNENVAASRLTEQSVINITRLGNMIVEHLARYSNAMLVSSSFVSNYTGFYLKNVIVHNAKSIDYGTEKLLDKADTVPEFVETRLKKALCKNNVIIAERDVCDAILRYCNCKACLDENSVYYITYLPDEDKFIYRDCIK